MDSGFSPMNVPPGANDFDKEKDNPTPWYKRWYVWALPAIVLGGVILAFIGQ